MEVPFGINELRPDRVLTEITVGCHVNGCTTVLERMRDGFQANERFLCKRHGIFISPSTYQYEDHKRNLLWREDDDRAVLDRILKVKRTSQRLGRERDEDALTWNIVRAFHREKKLGRLAEILLAGTQAELPLDREPLVIYWSADLADRNSNVWELLTRARGEFGEDDRRGTEPDIVLYWPARCLIFVEAKFCAPNRTHPSPKPIEDDARPMKYGKHPHFAEVFNGSYREIAVTAEKYELMRLWLLGSWIAKCVDRDAAFYLVNLVRWGEETDVEQKFGRAFCRETEKRRFIRTTWEQIWDALPATGLSTPTVCTLDSYFRDKSCGYDASGRLQQAFTAQEDFAGDREGIYRGTTPSPEIDSLWFQSRDAWRRIWSPPRTIQQLIFRILRGSNDAAIDLHHLSATECDLDDNIARNIVEAFRASGWRPPDEVAPRSDCHKSSLGQDGSTEPARRRARKRS